jgi:hypothetical protein
MRFRERGIPEVTPARTQGFAGVMIEKVALPRGQAFGPILAMLPEQHGL